MRVLDTVVLIEILDKHSKKAVTSELEGTPVKLRVVVERDG